MMPIVPDDPSGWLRGVVHPDDTREFWAALGTVMPDYDGQRERLREVGVSLRGQVVMQAAQGDRTG